MTRFLQLPLWVCLLAGQLLAANADLVMQLARPFAADPSMDNLISIRPGQAVG